MNVLKQLLCRWFLLTGLALSCLLASGVMADALAQVKTERSGRQAPLPAPQDVLQNSVRQWASEQQKTPVEALEVAPLDPRLKVQACALPLVMDQPFGNPEDIRVRCTQPVWQLFVKVSNRLQPARSQVATARETPPNREVRRKVLVAAGVLPRGTVLNETHVVLAEVDTSSMGSPAYEAVADVMYSEVIRDLRPGQPIRTQDVRPTLLVKRGQTVLLTVGQSQGFQITARVEALQDGRMGEKVQLKNVESGKILTGVVKGPNVVQGY